MGAGITCIHVYLSTSLLASNTQSTPINNMNAEASLINQQKSSMGYRGRVKKLKPEPNPRLARSRHSVLRWSEGSRANWVQLGVQLGFNISPGLFSI